MDYRRNNNEPDGQWVNEYDFAVSHLITEARVHSKLTQKKLAEKIGTTQSSVARAESGAVLPSHGLLKRIADAIGTSLLPPEFEFMRSKKQAEITADSAHADELKAYTVHTFISLTPAFIETKTTADQKTYA